MARLNLPKGAKTEIHCNGLTLNSKTYSLTTHGKTHHLTPMECRLLAILMIHTGEILSRQFLMRKVWQTEYFDDTRTLEVHMCWLRKKVEIDPGNPQLIRTVRGVGYVFAGG